MTGSLQTRLLLTVGALALTAVAAVALLTRQGTRQDFAHLEELERRADQSRGSTALARVGQALEGRCCDRESMAAAARELDARLALFVTEADGGALIASAGKALDGAVDLATSRRGTTFVIDAATVRDGRRELMSLRIKTSGMPLTLAGGRLAQLYVVPLPSPDSARHRDAFLMAVDLRLLWTTVIVGTLALALTWATVRSSVRPIQALRDATRELARGRLKARVVPRGGREIVELSRDFNAMADELERQQVLRQQLLHDVAHELRTPLTALQCRLETVIDGMARDPARAVRDLHDEVRHLTRLVDDLQDVALAEARELSLDVRDVAVEDVVASAVAAAGLEGDPRLTVRVERGLTVCADRVRLRQVLLNLLTNASRHAAGGGTIAIDASDQGGERRLTVRNTGSHLAVDEASRVFDRFYRTDPSRQRTTGGSGLGLAIVKHLVEAHGGRVWVSSEAESVTFGVALPGQSGKATA
jgi:signal transduction histidine kinase